MKKKFGTRITIIFGGLIVFMLFIQIIFNTSFSKDYFISKKEQEIEELFEKIKENYSNEPEELYKLTSEENEIAGISIMVFTEDGVIYSSRVAFGTMYVPRPVDLMKYSSNPNASMISSDNTQFSGGLQTVGLQGVFSYEGGNVYIALSAPLESIENSIALFSEASVVIALFIMVIGSIVIYIVANRLTKPIKDVEMVAKKVAQLDFSVQADESASSYEMASLSKSINMMSNQLNNTIIELQKDIDYQKQSEEMKKQFIANVSHEMKTPLALLQIYTESLKNNTEGIDRDMYYDVIIEETQRLNTIVQDMLNLSNIEHGLSKMHFEQIYLTGLCNEVLQTYQFLTQEYQLVLSIDGDIYVHGDRKHLQEAMRNYINNAISHIEPKGQLMIRLDKLEGSVRFSVYNDGALIEIKKIEQIWNSFYKTDDARTTKEGVHAGLGLHIVKIIIQNHKGTFHVENKAKGVEFSFTLPTYQKI